MTKILSKPIEDKKLKAHNFMTEMSIGDYYELVKDIMDKNEFQRSRVRSSQSVYSLLKKDLIDGCVIPPIVLALDEKLPKEYIEEYNKLEDFLTKNKNKIFILDGLQRTFTIKEIFLNASSENPTPGYKDALRNVIRVEIYTGLDKEGVLYRMLTLNTGQTPMSLRHQIEIIYSGMNTDGKNYVLVSDKETNFTKAIGNYKYSDAIDGFTSFMESDYLQITREKLLNTIKSFDKLSRIKGKEDLFSSLMTTYTEFMTVIKDSITPKDIEEELCLDHPFGTDVFTIFSKSQPLTGFGAAIARLMDLEVYKNIDDLLPVIREINVGDMHDGIIEILTILNEFKATSKKIGNSQRCFFYFFFKNFFDKDSVDNYLHAAESAQNAKKQHDRDL